MNRSIPDFEQQMNKSAGAVLEPTLTVPPVWLTVPVDPAAQADIDVPAGVHESVAGDVKRAGTAVADDKRTAK